MAPSTMGTTATTTHLISLGATLLHQRPVNPVRWPSQFPSPGVLVPPSVDTLPILGLVLEQYATTALATAGELANSIVTEVTP